MQMLRNAASALSQHPTCLALGRVKPRILRLMRRINIIIAAIAALAAASIWAYEYQAIRELLALGLVLSLTIVSCVGWVLACLDRGRIDDQTRCRKCGHILRGLSEPRCPECGERI